MTRQTVIRNYPRSSRLTISDSALAVLEAGNSDDVDVAETRDVVPAIIDSKDTERSLTVSPR